MNIRLAVALVGTWVLLIANPLAASEPIGQPTATEEVPSKPELPTTESPTTELIPTELPTTELNESEVTSTPEVLASEEPADKKRTSPCQLCENDPWCVCLLYEMYRYPSGYSIYYAERHEDPCGTNMDCGYPEVVYIALETGSELEDCEAEGCSYGFDNAALQRSSKSQFASLLKEKVPHNFEPSFSPDFPGEFKVVDTSYVSFVANGATRRAKLFMVKVTPDEITERNPERITALGFEVETESRTEPSLKITNKHRVQELAYGLYHIRVGGMIYSVFATADQRDATASGERENQPTLAAKP